MRKNARFDPLCAILVCLVSGVWSCGTQSKTEPDRVYRIGFSVNARPLHFADQDGKPDGLAVAMVAEAARRRSIRLSWATSATPGIPAMKKGEVDFWVLMTDLPERRTQVHFTDPFLVTEYGFLVRDESSYRQYSDLSHARINTNGFEITNKRLSSLLPNAVVHGEPIPQASLDALVSGSADAVFFEQYAISDLVLSGHPAKSLRVIAAPTPIGNLSLAANFNVSKVADEIRAEMRAMEADGTLTPMFRRWSLFPNQNLDATSALSTARRRERGLVAGLILLLLSLLSTIVLLFRFHRQRNRLKAAEQVLREREKDQRTLIELLPDTIYVVHDLGRIAGGMPGFRLIQGNDPALSSLLASPDHRANVDEVVATGRMVVAEQFSEDGRYLEYRLVPSREPGGPITGVMGILRDRSNQRHTEDERARLEEQLRQSQKMEVIGRLAGGVAHDFNNLLTVIIGYCQLLLNRFAADSPERARVIQIDTAAQSAVTLTRQLLAFSRRQSIKPKPCDLNGIVSEASEMVARLLGQDIEFEVDLAPDLPVIVVDRGQINQVLMNLAANARDAMPSGGRFAITTGLVVWTVGDAMEYMEGAPGTCVMLAASDTGPGMDRATAEKIFEPFFTTKPEGRGTGLGLSTVYGIVRQSGGWIRVHSQPGTGTTFRIFLPLPAHPISETLPPEAQRPETGAVSHTGGIILVVEDQKEILAFEAEVLTARGYSVITASDPWEALRISELFPGEIDLLLTDVVMPGLRGPELAKRIRSQRPGIKLLFASGYAGDFHRERDGLILESFLLFKPFEAEMLSDAVQRCLANQTPAGAPCN